MKTAIAKRRPPGSVMSQRTEFSIPGEAQLPISVGLPTTRRRISVVTLSLSSTAAIYDDSMFLKSLPLIWAFLAVATLPSRASAQANGPAPPKEVAGIPVNYDEARVGTYTLPDPLRLLNGKRVRNAKTWYDKRRPEIVRLFEENQFGRAPGRPEDMSFDIFDKGTGAFGGKAIRKQVTVYFSKAKDGPKMDLLLYLPAKAQKPVPVLLNISFSANCVTVDDPGVKEGEVWSREKKKVPAKKGFAFGRVNVVPLIDAGFGFATVYYGDIEPDFEGGLPYGVRQLYLKPGQTESGGGRMGRDCGVELGAEPRARLSCG